MEYPFSPKEKGASNWNSRRGQSDSIAPLDVGTRNMMSSDAFNGLSEFLSFDSCPVWCNSPSTLDQMFDASYELSSFESAPYGSLDSLNFAEKNSGVFPDSGDASNAARTSYSCSGEMGFQHSNLQFSSPTEPTGADDLGTKHGCGDHNPSDMANDIIPRPMGLSIDEKMLQALSLLKTFSGGGILAQVWVPMRCEGQYFLTTSEQPYLLDQMLAGYREVSRKFHFSAELKPGLPLGLPGRVFISKMPEWTSNVIYYSSDEYLRVKHAVDHEVRGSIAVPVFDPQEMSCCAVLELVTVKEKMDFDAEMENVCNALQAVNLRGNSPPRLLPQCLSRNQRAALAEITDVLRAVCHAHRLPLALTWIPCDYSEEAIDEIVKVRVREGNSRSDVKCILCIESTACYVNDKEMEGFVHACGEHCVEEGQGIAGKALQSNHPFFFPDVKTYDITEYPLVHHARKYGLNAAVAIRLRSTYTGDDDYILEFFLPVNIKGSSEQQLLLNNLSWTMQRICKSLRTISDAELAGKVNSEVDLQTGAVPSFPPMSTASRNSQTLLAEGNLNLKDKIPKDVIGSKVNGKKSDAPCGLGTSGPRKRLEKKRNAAEKNVSLSVLQRHFSGTLKDAAKSIGVCPTTLKRICRQHGISRWPSRKINKVNRSLRKIQTVLDTVQGVDGGLKFDPTSGGLLAASSFIQDAEPHQGFLFPKTSLPVGNPEPTAKTIVPGPAAPCNNGNNCAIKVEEVFPLGSTHVIDCCEDSKSISASAGSCQQTTSLGSGPWPFLENVSEASCSVAGADDIDNKMEDQEGVVDHNQLTCSSMTDSNYSGSHAHGSSSSSHSCKGRQTKAKISCDESGSQITVKATYKDDMVRFKFETSGGCSQLYEEVAKRFNLQKGAFQLKYLDDEDEWVMLVNDSDLQECLEVLEFVGRRSAKFLVRDVQFSLGSSGCSSGFSVSTS